MKRTLLVYSFTLMCLSLMAQKVDLDKFYFTATYTELPRHPLDPSYRTFSVHVETGQLCRMAMPVNELGQNVFIDGWKRLDGGAHVNVDIRIEDVVVEKVDPVERQELIKDKYGKQIGVRMHYSTQLTYSFAA